MTSVIDHLRGGLIVSCQAPSGTPLHGARYMAAMAVAAQLGGAVGIRAEGAEDVAAIKAAVDLPVIGIRKVHRPPSQVYITGTFADAADVARAGADMVALDATGRERPGGERLADLVRRIHEDLGVPVMADVDTVDAGADAAAAGADVLASTLSGYTGGEQRAEGPDLALVAGLASLAAGPVIAEGRIWTVEDAVQAMHAGADAVVVGTAITNPMEITRRFARAISSVPARST